METETDLGQIVMKKPKFMEDEKSDEEMSDTEQK